MIDVEFLGRLPRISLPARKTPATRDTVEHAVSYFSELRAFAPRSPVRVTEGPGCGSRGRPLLLLFFPERLVKTKLIYVATRRIAATVPNNFCSSGSVMSGTHIQYIMGYWRKVGIQGINERQKDESNRSPLSACPIASPPERTISGGPRCTTRLHGAAPGDHSKNRDGGSATCWKVTESRPTAEETEGRFCSQKHFPSVCWVA